MNQLGTQQDHFTELFGSEPIVKFVWVASGPTDQLHGFVAGNSKWNKTTAGPRKWCKVVREYAINAGFNEGIVVNRDRPLFFYTAAAFNRNTHPDPENVHKLMKDAIMLNVKGKDKYTGGTYEPPMYDAIERVEMFIWHLG